MMPSQPKQSFGMKKYRRDVALCREKQLSIVFREVGSAPDNNNFEN